MEMARDYTHEFPLEEPLSEFKVGLGKTWVTVTREPSCWVEVEKVVTTDGAEAVVEPRLSVVVIKMRDESVDLGKKEVRDGLVHDIVHDM